MATQPSKFRHKHRVTFTYPTKDPLELRFEGPSGPAIYLPFDEGEQVVDKSGNGLDAVAGGTVAEIDGKFGKAAQFAGYPSSGNYITRGANDTQFDIRASTGEGFTVSFWLRPATAPGYSTLVRKFTTGSGPGWIMVLEPGPGRIYLFWSPNANFFTTSSIPAGQWTHVVLKVDATDTGETVQWWINGVKDSTTASYVDPGASTDHLRIADNTGVPGAVFYDGDFDDFAIWNRALTDSEIQALYNSGVGLEVRDTLTEPVATVRYVDKEVPDVDGANTFAATPSMEIDFGARTGTFNESLTSILLPQDSFTSAISKGEPFAPIEVLIERLEFAANGTINSTHPVFRGYVLGSTRNPNGRPNRVLVKCLNLKNRLRVPMGIPATAECALTFMGPGCRVDPFDLGLVKQGTITAISGKQVTFTASYVGSPPWSGAENERLYQRGFIIRNGVRIAVREFDAAVAQDTLHLVRRCPSSWLNQTVLLIPGCDKSYETCLSRWDNAARFGGYGRVIPLYNPTVETR